MTSLLLLAPTGAPSLTTSLVVGVANDAVTGGNEGGTEDGEGRGEVFKMDEGDGGSRWLAGDTTPKKN